MSLTNSKIQTLKPKVKMYRVADAGGLCLEIRPSGAKYWRYRYRFDGKATMYSIGEYPFIGLAEARRQHAELKALLSQSINPAAIRNEAKAKSSHVLHFYHVAKQWHDHKASGWSMEHAHKVWRRLELYAFPTLGDLPIDAITPVMIIKVVRAINDQGKLDVAERVRSYVNSVYRFAVQRELVVTNPASELVGIVDKRKVKHRDSLPREYLRQFLTELDSYHAEHGGYIVTELALKMLMLTFVRSTELRGARWEEFDLGDKLWRIPAERMKMKAEHLVPITPQLEALLAQTKQYMGADGLLFPAPRNHDKPLSDNTLRTAIFRLGYDGQTADKPKALPHGMRALASSILNEQGFNRDAIERQLAHTERNKIRGAYTHQAEYLAERREIMQWWAEYLVSNK